MVGIQCLVDLLAGKRRARFPSPRTPALTFKACKIILDRPLQLCIACGPLC